MSQRQTRLFFSNIEHCKDTLLKQKRQYKLCHPRDPGTGKRSPVPLEVGVEMGWTVRPWFTPSCKTFDFLIVLKILRSLAIVFLECSQNPVLWVFILFQRGQPEDLIFAAVLPGQKIGGSAYGVVPQLGGAESRRPGDKIEKGVAVV